jgi:hypothetical protein
MYVRLVLSPVLVNNRCSCRRHAGCGKGVGGKTRDRSYKSRGRQRKTVSGMCPGYGTTTLNTSLLWCDLECWALKLMFGHCARNRALCIPRVKDAVVRMACHIGGSCLRSTRRAVRGPVSSVSVQCRGEPVSRTTGTLTSSSRLTSGVTDSSCETVLDVAQRE